jgi:hypothetical protein
VFRCCTSIPSDNLSFVLLEPDAGSKHADGSTCSV